MINSILKLLIAVIGISPALSYANCMHGEEVDLRKVNRVAFENIQVTDQGNLGICYAHAATTLIDFARITKKSDRYQTALDPMAAAILSTSQTEDELEGGHVCNVVNGLMKAGFGCSFSGVSVKQVKGFGIGIHTSLINQVFMPYVLKDKKFEPVDPKLFSHTARKNNASLLSKDQKQYLEHMDEFMKAFFVELKMREIPRDRLPGDRQLFEFFQNVYVNNRWASLESDVSYMVIRSTCENNKFSMPKMSCEEYSNTQYDLVDIVDAGLRKGVPTGASICSAFLANKKYKGTNTNGTNKSDCGEHAVVVIGKREQGGFCQYLIRNSWGVNARYDWDSSNGDVWVDEFALKANIYQAQVVR